MKMSYASRIRLIARWSAGVLLTVNVASLYAQAPAAPANVELLAPIRETVSAVTPKAMPAAPLRLIRGHVASGGARPPADRYYERLDNGLWGVTLVITVRGAVIRRQLTLQGMLPLATVSEIDRDYDVNSFVPFGPSIVAFGVTKNLKANGSTNTTSLSGDLERLVAPAQGTAFSFEHAWEANVTTPGVFGGTRSTSLSLGLQQKCVAEKEGEANTLHEKLRGKFLLVRCEGKLNNGSARSDEFAYLPESGVYVLLGSSTNGNTDRYTIADVEYVK
jgi:hypothetical protein